MVFLDGIIKNTRNQKHRKSEKSVIKALLIVPRYWILATYGVPVLLHSYILDSFMKWVDIYDIVVELEDNYPEVDNVNLRFTDLHKWVVGLEVFDDNPDGSNEKILEAIQMAWIEERGA